MREQTPHFFCWHITFGGTAIGEEEVRLLGKFTISEINKFLFISCGLDHKSKILVEKLYILVILLSRLCPGKVI
jgi:hypothetical protein